MPFPLVGGPGSLFNGLGKMGAIVADIYALQQTLEPALIDNTNGVIAQLQAFPQVSALIGDNYVNQLTSVESPCSFMQTVAQSFLNALVYAYQPQYNQNLTTPNLALSINYVLQQMAAQGATVLQITVGSVPGTFVGIGTGVVAASLKRPFDGRYLENAFAETLTFTCTADSYIGGQSAGNEQFLVTGQGAESDVFAFDWPLGSNASTSVNAINGDASNSQGNLLVNSGFESWTSNIPNNWTLANGTAGTSIKQNSSIVYSQGSSLQMVGDGSTLVSLVQPLGSSTGSSATLSEQTQYSVNFYIRGGASAPSQGVLQVDLIDENDNIINDQAGNPNSFTINLTSLGVSWKSFTGFFRLPEIMPSSYSFRFHLTTALPNGYSIYIDKVSMGQMTQLYTQGPFIAVHSGNTPFVQSPVPDYCQCQITNSRGAGGTLSTFQTLWYQLFPLAAQFEILLPSSLSPSISDGLIS